MKVFAPIVRVTRTVIGPKEFAKVKGKSISLHSQIVTEFCKYIGASQRVRQNIIRLAKKNGEQLGFLD